MGPLGAGQIRKLLWGRVEGESGGGASAVESELWDWPRRWGWMAGW